MHIGVPDRRIENNTPNEFRQPFPAEKRPDVFGHTRVSVLLVFLFRILSVNLIEILRVNPLSVRSAIETSDEVRVHFGFREFRRKVRDRTDRPGLSRRILVERRRERIAALLPCSLRAFPISLPAAAFVLHHPAELIVLDAECRRLPFVNFACVETQVPNYPIFPVWSLTSCLRLSQHHSRLPGRRFVVPHHSLRFLRLIRCQIMRPPKPDGLKPKFRLHLERSRGVPRSEEH